MNSSSDSFAILQFAAALFARTRRHVRSGAAVAALAMIWLLTRTPEFESRAAFQPATTSVSASRLGGLAAQFGLDIGGSGGAGTPDLYRALLSSRPILEKLAAGSTTYSFRRTWLSGSDSRTGSVQEAIGTTDDDSLAALEQSVKELRSRVQIAIVRESGIVQFRVRLPSPELSHYAASALLGEVNAFNVSTRQSQAHAERVFVENRLAVAQEELERAEHSVRDFLQANRNDPRTSPRLALEYERRQRVIDNASQVVTSLTQSLEQSRIDEVRDTPVITILEPPSTPTEPAGLSLPLRIVASILLGILASLLLALSGHLVEVLGRTDPKGMRELRALVPAARVLDARTSPDEAEN